MCIQAIRPSASPNTAPHDSVRTVRRFGLDCPEVLLYSVDTVVVEDEAAETFALWGVLGGIVEKPGALFTRPENVVAV